MFVAKFVLSELQTVVPSGRYKESFCPFSLYPTDTWNWTFCFQNFQATNFDIKAFDGNLYVVFQLALFFDDDRRDKRIVLSSDSNHFDPRCFGKGKVWHPPKSNLMMKHYEKVKAICEGNGIEVFNAGIGGKLEGFPRISYEEAISACIKSKRASKWWKLSNLRFRL